MLRVGNVVNMRQGWNLDQAQHCSRVDPSIKKRRQWPREKDEL